MFKRPLLFLALATAALVINELQPHFRRQEPTCVSGSVRSIFSTRRVKPQRPGTYSREL